MNATISNVEVYGYVYNNNGFQTAGILGRALDGVTIQECVNNASITAGSAGCAAGILG